MPITPTTAELAEKLKLHKDLRMKAEEGEKIYTKKLLAALIKDNATGIKSNDGWEFKIAQKNGWKVKPGKQKSAYAFAEGAGWLKIDLSLVKKVFDRMVVGTPDDGQFFEPTQTTYLSTKSPKGKEE